MFEQQDEILFFEEDTHIMDKPPSGDHTACGTPNPPPSCSENATNIDMYLLILVVAAVLIKTIYNKI